MNTHPTLKLPYFTLLLLISFASVNAVLFTPALPDIAKFFSVSIDATQQTITLFLIGYTFGQLVYGPLANRFGRKPALYAGITLQIISCFICVLSGVFDLFSLLLIGRFFLALGAGVGLKMTFTIVNEVHAPAEASKKISYLILAFAITPGLGVALGGWLTQHYGWMSCFYASAIYGFLLLLAVTKLPETLAAPEVDALKLDHLLHAYAVQFKNLTLIGSGVILGAVTSFVYLFAAIAPFISIEVFHMTSSAYGFANLLPPIGLIAGSLVSARLTGSYPMHRVMQIGISIGVLGTFFMGFASLTNAVPLYSLFIPMVIIYFGLSMIMANISSIGMSQTTDKAHGAAVMHFVNMGLATVLVLSLPLFTMTTILLPSIFLALCVLLITVYGWISKNDSV